MSLPDCETCGHRDHECVVPECDTHCVICNTLPHQCMPHLDLDNDWLPEDWDDLDREKYKSFFECTKFMQEWFLRRFYAFKMVSDIKTDLADRHRTHHREIFKEARDHARGYPEETKPGERAHMLWNDIEDKPHKALRYIDDALKERYQTGVNIGKLAGVADGVRDAVSIVKGLTDLAHEAGDDISIDYLIDRLEEVAELLNAPVEEWVVCSDCNGDTLVGPDGEACNCVRYGSRPGFERKR